MLFETKAYCCLRTEVKDLADWTVLMSTIVESKNSFYQDGLVSGSR